jgi:hypothetical protein
MAFPLIAWDNFVNLSTTTVTDPGSASGYPITNLSDRRAFTLWKSNQTAALVNIDIDVGAGQDNADYIGLVNHNLTTLGATVRVLADTVNPPLVQVLAATTPAADGVALLTFTAPGNKRYWRVTINHASLPFASAPFIGELWMGMKTECPEYVSPSFQPLFTDVEVDGDRSAGGHFLGASLRGKVHRGTLDFGGAAGVARADHLSTLTPFANNHLLKRYPFFFVLDTADTDFDDPYFIRMSDASRLDRGPVGSTWARLRFAFECEEAWAEAA